MTTVAQLRDSVGRMLTNPTLSDTDDGLFYDAIGAALDAILPWVPKTMKETITGTGASVYTLPTNLYEVEACVIDSTGEILQHAVLAPGLYLGNNIAGSNDWLEFPHGSISFSKAIQLGETYSLYYLAHWDKPVDSDDDEDVLEPPEFCHLGIRLYTTAYMIYPDAISSAEVRQFNTKVDSGNPEHNPMQRSATYLLKLFVDEMNRHPRYQKAQR